MRKIELIYLHALFATLQEQLEERHDFSPDAFAEYERNGVGPYQIQRPKDDHRTAIRLLASSIAASVGDSERERRPEAERHEA